MNDTVHEVISKLQEYKAQGKTFYEASNLLREQGYTKTQITDAQSQYDYHDPEPDYQTADTRSAASTDKKVSDKDYQKLGNRILADKERTSRLFIYALFPIIVGDFARQVYRFYLGIQSQDPSRTPKNLWARGFENFGFPNIGRELLAGAFGAMATIIGLWLYYRHRDRWYKQIEKKIDDDTSK